MGWICTKDAKRISGIRQVWIKYFAQESIKRTKNTIEVLTNTPKG